MTELEATAPRVIAVMWLVVWRGVLGGGVLGAIAGAAVGIIFVAAGMPGPHPIAGGLAGLAVSIPWYFVVFRMALRKQYRGFRIALIAT